MFIDSLFGELPLKVVMPLYPKAPVHSVTEVFPKMTDMYRKLKAESDGKFILMGDSAGASLAVSVAQALGGDEQPKEIISISPWLDIGLCDERIADVEKADPMLNSSHLRVMGRAWAKDVDLKDFRVSPLYGPIEHLAPVTLFAGTHELFLIDARTFYDRCIDAGVDIMYIEKEKMNHDFPLFPVKRGKRL